MDDMDGSFKEFKEQVFQDNYLTDDESDHSCDRGAPSKKNSEETFEQVVEDSIQVDANTDTSMHDVLPHIPRTPVGKGSSIDAKRPVPVTSTPRAECASPHVVPSLSDSLASLTIEEDSPYGHEADRSRSFIDRRESAEALSPISARLTAETTSRGKLRDRLLRKALSKARHDKVYGDVEVLWSRADEPVDIRAFTQHPCDDVVDESVSLKDLLPSDDDDVIILDNSDVKAEQIAECNSCENVVPDVITILSSSDEGEGPCDGAIDEGEGFRAEVVKTVTKFSHDTTGMLEGKLANLNKLIAHPLALPDGGAKLFQQRIEVAEELKIRKEICFVSPRGLKPRLADDVEVLKVVGEPVPLFPLFQDRRHLNGNNVLMDSHPAPVYKAIQEKALVELHKALNSQPDPKDLSNTPEGLICTLKEHQKSGLTWMKWRESLDPKGGILADEMGLGKTLSMIALVVDAKLERKRRRTEGRNEVDKERKKHIREQGLTPTNGTLVIAPAALIYHWESEIKARCEDGLLKIVIYHNNWKKVQFPVLATADVVITTYTLAVNEMQRAAVPGAGSSLANLHWARIILDEAHCIKNKNTKSSKAVCRLNADARWCVTGTPLHNNLWDLYSLMRFLRVEYFGEEKFWKDYVASGTKKSVERLNLLMKNYVLRREKSFLSPLSAQPIVELPQKHSHEHMLEFSDAERKAYNLMYEASRTKIKELLTEDEVEKKFGTRTKETAAPLTARNVFLLDNCGKTLRANGLEMHMQTERLRYFAMTCSELFSFPNFLSLSCQFKAAEDSGAGGQSNPDTNFQKMGCMLVLLLRLRQACIHFSLTRNAVDLEAFQSIGAENPLSPEEQENLADITIDSLLDAEKVEDLTHIFRKKHVSAKIQLTLDLISSILESGDKCVIVSQWTSFLKIVEKHINKRFPSLAKCSSITGEIQPSDRQDRVNSFNEDNDGVNIMLISITAGGVGLNLTGGNHLILMDLHWNPALELQARDRVHRMGQRKEVHLHKIIMKGSIEERVLDLQLKKMELAKNVLMGAVSKKNMNLTMADLKFLFDLDRK